MLSEGRMQLGLQLEKHTIHPSHPELQQQLENHHSCLFVCPWVLKCLERPGQQDLKLHSTNN